MRPLITLTTDFGLDDPFVGIMKGVILNIEPNAHIIDITHNIEPQNILQAARVLNSTFPWYPRETIHIVVVDPGVGGLQIKKSSAAKDFTACCFLILFFWNPIHCPLSTLSQLRRG